MKLDKLSNFVWRWKIISISTVANTNLSSITEICREASKDLLQNNKAQTTKYKNPNFKQNQTRERKTKNSWFLEAFKDYKKLHNKRASIKATLLFEKKAVERLPTKSEMASRGISRSSRLPFAIIESRKRAFSDLGEESTKMMPSSPSPVK